jgi:hypothetical protein
MDVPADEVWRFFTGHSYSIVPMYTGAGDAE